MKKNYIIISAIFGFLAVALGAFGAHGLKDILIQNNTSDIFEKASKYHFYHTIIMLVISFYDVESKLLRQAFLTFLIGIVIFSGSLYIFALTNIKILGAVTPFGGLAFLAGWVLIILYGIKGKN